MIGTHDIRDHFATPLLESPEAGDAALSAALRDLVLAREQQGQGIVTPTLSWASDRTLLTWSEPPVQKLLPLLGESTKAMIAHQTGWADVTGELRLTAWGMILRYGDYVPPHNEGDCMFAGYYVAEAGDDAPEDRPASGAFECLDPRTAVGTVPTPGNPYGRSAVVVPRTGTLFLFPSWLSHYMNPYVGESDRVLIGFTATVLEVKQLSGSEAAAPAGGGFTPGGGFSPGGGFTPGGGFSPDGGGFGPGGGFNPGN